MLGVLLQRPKAKREFINDRNSRIVNFFRVLRDRSDEFYDYMKYTTDSRDEFEAHIPLLDSDNPIERAAAFYVCVYNSFHHSDWNLVPSNFISLGRGLRNLTEKHIENIRERLHGITIENQCATKILKRLESHDWKTLVYCDPPYPTRNADQYSFDIDPDKFMDSVRNLNCRVAISGYPGEWDALGWRCETKQFHNHVNTAKPGQERKDITECLWFNYDESYGRLF